MQDVKSNQEKEKHVGSRADEGSRSPVEADGRKKGKKGKKVGREGKEKGSIP